MISIHKGRQPLFPFFANSQGRAGGQEGQAGGAEKGHGAFAGVGTAAVGNGAAGGRVFSGRRRLAFFLRLRAFLRRFGGVVDGQHDGLARLERHAVHAVLQGHLLPGHQLPDGAAVLQAEGIQRDIQLDGLGLGGVVKQGEIDALVRVGSEPLHQDAVLSTGI